MTCRTLSLGNDEDPRKHFLTILDMNFISIKNHEMKILQLLYFQAREPPAPLNIPIATLAPDWGGPVA